MKINLFIILILSVISCVNKPFNHILPKSKVFDTNNYINNYQKLNYNKIFVNKFIRLRFDSSIDTLYQFIMFFEEGRCYLNWEALDFFPNESYLNTIPKLTQNDKRNEYKSYYIWENDSTIKIESFTRSEAGYIYIWFKVSEEKLKFIKWRPRNVKSNSYRFTGFNDGIFEAHKLENQVKIKVDW